MGMPSYRGAAIDAINEVCKVNGLEDGDDPDWETTRACVEHALNTLGDRRDKMHAAEIRAKDAEIARLTEAVGKARDEALAEAEGIATARAMEWNEELEVTRTSAQFRARRAKEAAEIATAIAAMRRGT